MENWQSNNGTRACPFRCESNQFEFIAVKGVSYVKCKECGAHGPVCDTIQQAEIAWNQREGDE